MDAPRGGLLRNPPVKAGLWRVGNKAADLSGTAWRTLYLDSGGNVTELALGASGTVFTSNGASSAPSFQAVASDMLNVMVSPFSRQALGVELAAAAIATPASAAYPTANLAIGVPFVVDQAATVVKMGWINGATASGNVDVGIYDESFVKKVTIGSTAQGTVSIVQEVNIADTALAAGRYYLVIATDNGTATFLRAIAAGVTPLEQLKMFGMCQMASAFPLPSTITPAVLTNNYIPWFGASLRTLVA